MNELVPKTKAGIVTIEDVKGMATQIVKSGLFPDINTVEKAFTLMMICQSEGLHPIRAIQRYNIIQNRPAMKADAMLAEFNSRRGVVKWGEYTDKIVEATFTHPNGSSITVKWTIEMAAKIRQNNRPLTQKDNWMNYPRQMLKARTISEGIRAIMPEVCTGIYTPEEVEDDIVSVAPEKEQELTPPQEKQPPQPQDPPPEPPEEQPAQHPAQETGAPASPQEETDDQKAKRLNARFIELKKQLGDADFNHILKKLKVATLRGISFEKAEEIIDAMETTLAMGEETENA